MTRTLLVIDIQNDYFAGGVLRLWQAEETEARIVVAIGKARAAGDQIVLVRHISSSATGLFAAGSPGSEIRPAILAVAGDAPVVTKHHADAFQDTDLIDRLAGTEDLLICGMMTQNCVAFTATSRMAENFEWTVVGDLCTAPIEIVHQVALAALRSKGHVLDAAEVWR